MNVLVGPRTESRRVVLGGRIHTCRLEDDQLVLEDGRSVPETEAVYAPPVAPGLVACVHLNYRSRADEFGVELEGAHPTYFLKPPGSVNVHRGAVRRPSDCAVLNYEGELAAVVGRPMHRIRPEDTWDHLAGFTCANDVGAHDFRDTDAGSMLRVKGQDGFCPLGPGLVRGVDVRQSVLRTFVNGKKVQEGAISDMVWGIDELFADLSRHLTLRPGDVVLTGTPWHSRPIFPGDQVEVDIEGIGRLSNVVVEAPAPENFRGFPATASKTSLAVALGSDYRMLKKDGNPPTVEQYRAARAELMAKNIAAGPPRKDRP